MLLVQHSLCMDARVLEAIDLFSFLIASVDVFNQSFLCVTNT